MDAAQPELSDDPETETGLEPGSDLARDYVAQAYLGLWGGRETQDRLRERLHWMARQVQGPDVLDIGCSEGMLAILLAREGLRVVGIDINPGAIAYAETLRAQEEPFVRERARFLHGDILTTPLEAGPFDTVIIGEVIEHLVLPERLLDFGLSLLRPGGRLVVTTPFGVHPDPDHRQTFTPSRFVALMQARCLLVDLGVSDGYIRFVGARPPAGEPGASACAAAWSGLTPQALNAITEAGLLEIQTRLYRDLARRRKEVNTFKNTEANLRRRVGQLQQELREETRQRKERQQENQRLKTSLAQSRETLRTLSSDLKHRTRGETQARYQLNRVLTGRRYWVGSLLANATWPLRRLLLGPVRLLRGRSAAAARLNRCAGSTALAGSAAGGAAKARLTHGGQNGGGARNRIAFVEYPAPPPPGPGAGFPTIATLLDPFSEACLRYEAHLVPVSKTGWREEIEAARPAFFLAESTWRGNGGAWTGAMTRFQEAAGAPLRELLAFCKAQGLPTVFWNKEDPPNFEVFSAVACAFDIIFTSDADCIPRYQALCGHDRVYALPFAAQPMIHNPLRWKGLPLYETCFAGSWFLKHPARIERLPALLDPALERGGLHIFDRMFDQNNDAYRFPEKYQPAIQGKLDYPQMLTAYRAYRVFLNTNSVIDSPTMFSRRVFEALACGTPVISSASTGMEAMLGAHVRVSHSAEDTRRHLAALLDNELERQRQAHLAYRHVHRQHTYQHRFTTICSAVNAMAAHALPPQPRSEPPLVSVIACTNRPENLENLLSNYSCQTHPHRELILVLNSDRFDRAAVEARVAALPGTRVLTMAESETLGDCLNQGIRHAQGPLWAKMDDDDLYGPEYLADSLLALHFSGADVVGKHTFFTYVEGLDQVFIRHPGHEHRYDTFIAGGTLLARRETWERVKFIPRTGGGDTIWLRECADLGMQLYSADKYNYILTRTSDPTRHTWKIDQDAFLANCDYVAEGLARQYAIL